LDCRRGTIQTAGVLGLEARLECLPFAFRVSIVEFAVMGWSIWSYTVDTVGTWVIHMWKDRVTCGGALRTDFLSVSRFYWRLWILRIMTPTHIPPSRSGTAR
jgi:hypothetical protein